MEQKSNPSPSDSDLIEAHSAKSMPSRGILAKMALAGIAAATAGGLGVVGMAAASVDAPIEPLPMQIPIDQGRSLSLDDLTEDVKALVGIADHGDMENWDDCPACGMG